MTSESSHNNVTQELLDAMTAAKQGRRPSTGPREFAPPSQGGWNGNPPSAQASEFGPGLSRNRAEVAPLVDREHRRAAEAVSTPIRLAPSRRGRPRPLHID